MHRFSMRMAGIILLVAFVAITIIHLLVLRGTIPYQLLWGGLAETNNIAALSLFAIGVSLFVVFVTASNLSYIPTLFPRVMQILMWIICGYLFSTPSEISCRTMPSNGTTSRRSHASSPSVRGGWRGRADWIP